MMNISKVQAHKMPKAATSTLQLVQSPKIIDVSLTFSIFPDHFGIP